MRKSGAPLRPELSHDSDALACSDLRELIAVHRNAQRRFIKPENHAAAQLALDRAAQHDGARLMPRLQRLLSSPLIRHHPEANDGGAEQDKQRQSPPMQQQTEQRRREAQGPSLPADNGPATAQQREQQGRSQQKQAQAAAPRVLRKRSSGRRCPGMGLRHRSPTKKEPAFSPRASAGMLSDKP